MTTDQSEIRERSIAPQRWIQIAIILMVFVVVDYLQQILSLSGDYRQLYDRFPFWVPHGAMSILQILLCVAVVRVIWANSTAEALRDLGIRSGFTPGFVFGAAASAPMFIGFALTTPIASPLVTVETAYLAGLSPLAEEILYRGFLCGLLYTRGGTPAWAAVGLSGVLFGWSHVDFGASISDVLGLLFLTGFGGLVFGWLFLRWRRNIWVPFFLHGCMNLSWNLFEVGDSALGGWYPFTLQLATTLLAIVFTLQWTKAIHSDEKEGPAQTPGVSHVA